MEVFRCVIIIQTNLLKDKVFNLLRGLKFDSFFLLSKFRPIFLRLLKNLQSVPASFSCAVGRNVGIGPTKALRPECNHLKNCQMCENNINID